MSKKIRIPDVPGFETTIEPIPEGVDPVEFLRKAMDDCPLCREARARGEVPEIHEAPRRNPFGKRPRWRDLKRTRQ